jgi:pimeloyl-ACP methyl ester carboxylesterase
VRNYLAIVMILSCAMATVAAASVADEPAAPARTATWQPNQAALETLAQRKTAWIYREKDVPAYTLPDPLLCADGTKVSDRQTWERKRRPELLELFRKLEYGFAPDDQKVSFEVTDNKAMSGMATLKTIKITATQGPRSFTFPLWLMVPNQRTRPVGCFVLINNRAVSSADPTRKVQDEFWPAEQIIARGYAAAVFQTNDVDPDKAGEEARAKGVRGAFSSPGKANEDAWATLAAWAWGASRAMDYLQTDHDIDPARVAVVGHSRGGKTALWAGAQDQRFSLVVSNDSGCGGAALSKRKFGETVALINKSFPYWFCGNFHQFDEREDQLPFDQHELLALIAPRGLYVASADEDFWADQRGEFLSLVGAWPVYALYGLPGMSAQGMPPLQTPLVRGRVAYHIRPGGHGLTLYDWQKFMDFADTLWKN